MVFAVQCWRKENPFGVCERWKNLAVFFLRNVFVILYDDEDTAVLHIQYLCSHCTQIRFGFHIGTFVLPVCNVILAVIKPDPFVPKL